MTFITVFFRENICNVVGTRYVLYVNEFLLNIFSNCIVSKLDMSNHPGCPVFTPLDACHVIVEDIGGFGEKFFGET